MKNFGLYDILGVLAPGSIMVVGIVALFPEALGLVKHDEFTAGEFGLVVLLSYAAGNLVAGLGNLLQIPYRWIKVHSPSANFRKDGRDLLSKRQLNRMQTKLRIAGMLDPAEELASVSEEDWQTLSREVYAFLGARKMTARIDTFNAEYGMNRGVALRFRGTGHPFGGGNKLDALAADASAPCLRWFSRVPNGALLALLRQGALYPVPCGVTGAPQTGERL